MRCEPCPGRVQRDRATTDRPHVQLGCRPERPWLGPTLRELVEDSTEQVDLVCSDFCAGLTEGTRQPGRILIDVVNGGEHRHAFTVQVHEPSHQFTELIRPVERSIRCAPRRVLGKVREEGQHLVHLHEVVVGVLCDTQRCLSQRDREVIHLPGDRASRTDRAEDLVHPLDADILAKLRDQILPQLRHGRQHLLRSRLTTETLLVLEQCIPDGTGNLHPRVLEVEQFRLR